MASISRRGDYQFQVIVRRKGYPSQTKTLESHAEAQEWARDVESQMDKAQFKSRRALKQMTLHDILERYLTTVSPKKRGYTTEANRIKQLQRHPIAQRSLDTLNSSDFADYRDARLKKVSPTTTRLELALLSNLYSIAINEWSLPLTHELKKVKKPTPNKGRTRRLIGDEKQRLLIACHRPQQRGSAIWLEVCVKLALETGMRAGEILSLEWHQIHLEEGYLSLQETKNGSERDVGLTREAIAVFAALPRNASQLVITNFYDTSGLDRAFKRACKAAGIQGLRFHDLRHDTATRLAPHLQVQDLAKVMGWETLQMAMRYYNPSGSEMSQLVRKASDSSAPAHRI